MDKSDEFIKNVDLSSAQYTTSRHEEIAKLLEKSSFKVVTIVDISTNTWIFNSRFVNEVKNASTDKAYAKIWLVVQVYNDQEKDLVLTQSPIIQWLSQRLIVCSTAKFQSNKNIKLYL